MVSSTVSDLSYALRPMRLAPVLTITIRPAHRQASQRQAIHKAGTIDPISLGVPAATYYELPWSARRAASVEPLEALRTD
jgi:hypothetical protein